MTDEMIIQILNLLHTMQEVCQELYQSVKAEGADLFEQISGDIAAGLQHIMRQCLGMDTQGAKNLSLCCRAVLISLQRIVSFFPADREKCLSKIEFELLPLLQETYKNFYVYEYLAAHPEERSNYYGRDIKLLCANSYIDDAVQTGTYQYDLSISVIAYNKLKYTKQCVESLLKNIPSGLKYELILVNHGSTDGTKEYFEGIRPNKQLDIAVNGVGLYAAVSRIVEGEFVLGVSNDVIVTKNAIENLLACIRSDSKIGWVVPTTPNVSNCQSIPAQYNNPENLARFAQSNNISDPFRWEQRIRLCDPIEMVRSSVFWSSDGILPYGYFDGILSFGDDQKAFLLRRRGYKIMLAKDAYCHHFGSVTIKDDLTQQKQEEVYMKGRIAFQRHYGIDPWGTGFCYDPVFFYRVVGEDTGHTEILGINCGMGSNSLKIKEQIKEHCHNLDTTLCNITDDPKYIEDLSGISDEAAIVSSVKELKAFLKGRIFHYIVWETPFLSQNPYETLLTRCVRCLDPTGALIIKLNEQCEKEVTQRYPNRKKLGNNWVIIRQEDKP